MDGHTILFTVLVTLLFDGARCQDVLPETLQPYNQNRTSTCYGLNSWFQPTCPDIGTVIAVQELTVGAKVNTTTCPDKVQDLGNGNFNNYTVGGTVDISCCRQETDDCTFAYDGHLTSVPAYKHLHICTGRVNCTTTAETVRSVTSSSGTCSGSHSYMTETSYMYMQYYCIDETRIGDMCGSVNETVTGSAFYIQSPGYPGNVSSTVTSCTCSVQSSICEDTINVYTVHVQMASDGSTCRQILYVNGTGTSITWDCDSETMFNITKQTTGDNYVVVQLDNTMTSDGGYIWLGFEANRPKADLVVTCPAVPESTCTTAPTTGNPEPSTGGGGGGIGIGVIIGAVVGLLLLIALAIIITCCCCCKKKGNKVEPDEEKPEEEEADNDIMKSSLRFEHSAPPANTHFHSNTPVPVPLRTSETPFIMKHSGVNNIDQDIPDTHPPPAPLPPIVFAKRPAGDLSTSLNGHLPTSGSASTSDTMANGVMPRGGRLTPITARDVDPSVDEKNDNEEGEKKKKKKHKKKHKRKSKKRDAEMPETQDDTANDEKGDPDKQDEVDESNA